ncbi:MAG: DUF3810 domain-containing protein [Bacteroidia bacterium]
MKTPLRPKRTKALPIDRRFIWIGLALISLIIQQLFSANPFFTELAYSRGLFPILRTIWDYTLGWSPIPLLYPAVLGLLFWIGIRWYKRRKEERPKRSVRQRLGRAFLNLLGLISIILVVFFWGWGYNYQRQPIEHRLEMQIDSLTMEDVEQEFLWATDALIKAHAQLGDRDTSQSILATALPEELEKHMRDNLKTVLQSNDYPTPGRVRARRVFPKGTLFQIGASGVYLPWIGEGHIDAALPPVSQPYTMAHELAHGYGFGDEGSCSFWAYLACMESENPNVRYSASFGYWREVAGQYIYVDTTSFKMVRNQLPQGVKRDLVEIRNTLKKYPGFFPKTSATLYDIYLKGQGIREGRANYSRVVDLLVAWRKSKGESG